MAEIKTIEDLPGIGATSAEKLKLSGRGTLLSIGVSSPSEIAELTGFTEAKARQIIQAAREALNFGFTDALADKKEKELTVYKVPTGSDEFDKLLNGGIESGIVTELHGRNGSGKSQLAHQLCVNIQKMNKDWKAIYIDTENCFSPKRITEMAEAYDFQPDEVLKNIIKAVVYNSDHQIFMTEKAEEEIKKDPNIKLLIVDSIIDRFRTDYQGRGELAERQMKLNKHVHTLHKIAQIYNIPVLITNQVMDDPGNPYGNPMKPVGGNVLGHVSRMRLQFSFAPSKQQVTAKLIKSRDIENGECVFRLTKDGIRD